jgi:hypothetical protein
VTIARRAKKIDANQKEIIANLRKCGFRVRSTASIGDGFPDIIVQARGCNFLFEIKMPGEKLTDNEEEFFAEWGDSRFVGIIHDTAEALEILAM